ncbi:hypothetical protein BDW75DRAFT_135879 [Aspergillus navahoensis]
MVCLGRVLLLGFDKVQYVYQGLHAELTQAAVKEQQRRCDSLLGLIDEGLSLRESSIAPKDHMPAAIVGTAARRGRSSIEFRAPRGRLIEMDQPLRGSATAPGPPRRKKDVAMAADPFRQDGSSLNLVSSVFGRLKWGRNWKVLDSLGYFSERAATH